MYTKDGLFKIPRARNDSCNSQSEQEYIIAQRTRSKISLAETPIEALESTLNPPDVTTDMYDNFEYADNEWIEFLSNFAMGTGMVWLMDPRKWVMKQRAMIWNLFNF